MTEHLGADSAALVDGELGHAARERALAHLAQCEACRAEVEAERRFKARLRVLGSAELPVAPDLAGRLLALQAAERPLAPPGRLGAAIGPPRQSPVRHGPRRPGEHRPGRVAVGGVVVAAGLGVVLLLGGSPRTPARPPVDPASELLLVDHAGITGEMALPVAVSSAGGP